MMNWYSIVPTLSPFLQFFGLLLVAYQIRTASKRRELDSMVQLYDINRQLMTLAFTHPHLLEIIEDQRPAKSLMEQRFLQLWLNVLCLKHTFSRRSIFTKELREELHLNLIDFLNTKNMRAHWEKSGTFYPSSFQKFVAKILKNEGPPQTAAHVAKSAHHHDAKT